jgi:hypothetical protein
MPAHEAIIGIDPGLKGAFAVLETATGHLLDKMPMPDSVQDLHKFLTSIKSAFPTVFIACEKAQTVPKLQSLKSAHTSGRNFGKLEAVIQLLYIPTQYFPPVTWQAELHKGADGPGPKDKSLSVAKNLWPCESFTFECETKRKPLKPHDGLVDAMLIAEFLRRRIK